jgi:hypothetical protein
MEQLLGGKWLRENVNVLKCVPVAESSIVNQTADHQDRQAGTLGPEILSRLVAGHGADVWADDQQIGGGFFQSIHRHADIASRFDKIPLGCEDVPNNDAHVPIGN